jgi:hypothetical protein
MFLANNVFVPTFGVLRMSQGGADDWPRQEGDEERLSLVLAVTRTHVVLRASDGTSMSLPFDRHARGTLHCAALGPVLAKTLAACPAVKGITLQVDDDVSYDDLIQLFDACVGAGFETVSVVPYLG